MSNAILICLGTLRQLLQDYKIDMHICLLYHSTMTSRRKRSATPVNSPAARKKRMEELEPNICTYWPNNLAFDPKRVLLRLLFFINEDRTKYVSVGFYPVRDYLVWGSTEGWGP